MKNLKDVATTISGIIGLLGVLLGIVSGAMASNGAKVPLWMVITVACCMGIPVAIQGYFSGKNPDGTTKTPDQISKANNSQ